MKLELNDNETNELIQLLNVACNAGGGLGVAAKAVYFHQRIQMAITAEKEEPQRAKEGDE
jgi:hypothetical protein